MKKTLLPFVKLRSGFSRSAGKIFVLTALSLGTGMGARGQYTQNFDAITAAGSATYDNLPEGWAIFEVGTGGAADGKYIVNNGSSNAGNAYSYGVLNSTDRALGSV
ncbi:MAG TPA: hypothetical protein VGB56_04835, partial [Flavisolibacter sp.]